MSRTKSAVAALVLAGMLPGATLASPAPPTLTVDTTFGKVAGWSIGFSESLGGCLAAASYGDGTTLWFGIHGTRGVSYLAFTNPKWRSLEVGGQYELFMIAGRRKWRGDFVGFDRARPAASSSRASRRASSRTSLIRARSGSSSRASRSPSYPWSGPRRIRGRARLPEGRAEAAAKGNANPDKSRKADGGMMSSGTGFYVSERGHLLTNNHVVESCTDIYVPSAEPARSQGPPRRAGCRQRPRRAHHRSSAQERAAVVDPGAARRERAHLRLPAEHDPRFDGNFTIGSVTATAGSGDDTRKIQISAPVHQGNSGGPGDRSVR